MLTDLRSCLKKTGYGMFPWGNSQRLYVECLKNLTHLLTLILLRDSLPIFLQHDKLLHLHRQNKYLPLYKQEENWDQLTFAKTSGDQRVLSNDLMTFKTDLWSYFFISKIKWENPVEKVLPFLLGIHSTESISSPPLPGGQSPIASYMKSWNKM